MTEFLLIMIGGALVGGVVMLRALTLSFRAQSPEDFDGIAPEFDIREAMRGELVLEGLIYGPFGRVVSRMTCDVRMVWDGNRGEMHQTFRYDSGRIQERCWYLTVLEDGRIEGTAADVEGAARGQQSGPSVQMLYRIRLPDAAGGHVLDVTDWMYLLQSGTILNRSQFRKLGLTVAELVATIRPKEV